MERAIATAWGGHLVHASKCSREDYYGILFRCPECNEVVYLKDDFTRVRKGNEEYVSACFAHHDLKHPELAKICSQRVRIYSEKCKKLERRFCQQRLALLQRHFWSIFCRHFYKGRVGEKGVNEVIENRFQYTPVFYQHQPEYFWQRTIEFCQNTVLDPDNLQAFRKTIDNAVDAFICGEFPDYYSEADKQPLLELRSKLQVDLHRLICHEVFDFLRTKSAGPILQKMLIIEYIYAPDRIEQEMNDIEVLIDKICNYVAMFAVRVPWQEEFTRLKQEATQQPTRKAS